MAALFRMRPDPTFPNITLTCTFAVDSGPAARTNWGLYWKHDDANDHGLQLTFKGSFLVSLETVLSGVATQIGSHTLATGAVGGGLVIEQAGSAITVTLDGTVIITATSSYRATLTGSAGIRTLGDSAIGSEWVSIYALGYTSLEEAGGTVSGFVNATANASVDPTGYLTLRPGVVNATATAAITVAGDFDPIPLSVPTYRFKDHVGGETDTTWLAAVNTPLAVDPTLQNYARLRFLVQNNSGTQSSKIISFLEYREVGAYASAWQSADANPHVNIANTTDPLSSSFFTGWGSALYFSERLNCYFSVKSNDLYKLSVNAALTSSLNASFTDVNTAYFVETIGDIVVMICSYNKVATPTVLTLGYSSSSDNGATWSGITEIGTLSDSAAAIYRISVFLDTNDFILVCVPLQDGTFDIVRSTNTAGTTWGSIVNKANYVTTYLSYFEYDKTADVVYNVTVKNVAPDIIIYSDALVQGTFVASAIKTFVLSNYSPLSNIEPHISSVVVSTGLWVFAINHAQALDISGRDTATLYCWFYDNTTGAWDNTKDTTIVLDTYLDVDANNNNTSPNQIAARIISNAEIALLIKIKAPAASEVTMRTFIFNVAARTVTVRGTSPEHTTFRAPSLQVTAFSGGATLGQSGGAVLGGTTIPWITSDMDRLFLNSEHTTQQLGAGTYLSNNYGMSNTVDSPSAFGYKRQIMLTGYEHEKEFLLYISKNLPSKVRFEYRLVSGDLNTPYSIIDTAEQDYLDANTALSANWTSNSWTIVAGQEGGNKLYASDTSPRAASGSFTFTVDTVFSARCWFTGARADYCYLKVDGVEHDSLLLNDTLIKSKELVTSVLPPGTYTISIEAPGGTSLTWVDNLRVKEFSTPVNFSTDTYAHTTFPYIANVAEATNMLGSASIIATGGGDIQVPGIVNAQANAFVSPTGFLIGTIEGATVTAADTFISAVAQVGQDEQGVVAMSAVATLAPTGLIYHTSTEHFRFRNDDGSEISATWLAPTDTTVSSITPGQTYRVRFAVENFGLATETNTTVGSMEVKLNNGAWETMGFNDNDTSVANALSTNTFVGDVTSTDTLELQYSHECIMYVDDSGVWHLIYAGRRYYTAPANHYENCFYRRSVNSGSTWSTPIYFDGQYDGQSNLIDKVVDEIYIHETSSGGLLICFADAMTADQGGFQFTLRSFLGVFSSNNGVSWSSPEIVPIFRNGNYNYLSNSVDDLIIVGVGTGYPRVDVSTNDGSSWNSFDYNDDTGVAAADVECVFAFGELQPNDDLDIYYAMPTFSGGTSYGKMKFYKYTMTHPYTDWPALIGGDDSARLVFESTTTLDAVSPFNYDEGFMYTTPTKRYYVWPFNDVKHASIVEEAGTWSESAWPFDIPTLWDTVEQTGGRGSFMPSIPFGDGERLLRAVGNHYARFSVEGNNPGVLGWYKVESGGALGSLSDANTYPFYSPAVNKWYACTTNSVTDKITYYEMTWSTVVDGGDTTQQISTGGFETPNQGMAPYGIVDIETASQLLSGNSGEYEYSFILRPSKAVAGDTICMRPSGWDTSNKPACFTIVSEEAHITATAVMVINGFTDGPKAAMTATAVAVLSGSIIQDGSVAIQANAEVVASHDFTKNSPVIMESNAALAGSVFLTKPAAVSMLVDAYVDMVSINIKRVAVSLSATASTLVSEPTVEVPAKVSILGRAFMYPTATKGLEAAASLHSYASVAADAEVDELCISITVYQSPSLLTIIESEALNVVDFPAKLTVNQPPVPDLVVTEQSPLQVQLYG